MKKLLTFLLLLFVGAGAFGQITINSYQHSAAAPLPDPNFFIGGVGAAYLTSASTYEGFSSDLTTGDVENFQNVSNNVSFFLDTTHDLDTSTPFINRDEMTYFIDADGYVNELYYFEDSQNCEYVYAPNAVNLGNQFSLQDMYNLKRINVSGVTTNSRRYQLSDARVLKVLDLRSLTTINSTSGQGAFNDNFDVEYLMLHSLQDTGVNANQYEISLVRNTGRAPTFYRTGRDNVAGKVFIHSNMGVKDRKAYVRGSGNFDSGDTVTIDGITWTCVTGAPADNTEFEDAGGNGTIDNLISAINADSRVGTGTSGLTFTAYNDNTFVAIECDTVGTAGDAIAVSVGGSNTGNYAWDESTFDHGNDVHVMIQELRDEQGMAVVEVAAAITINTPTGLSASSITTTGFTLNFTEPTANANGTEKYVVWCEEKDTFNPINYFYHQLVDGTGEVITGLESGKTYIVKVGVMDGDAYYGSFSSTIEVTTN